MDRGQFEFRFHLHFLAFWTGHPERSHCSGEAERSPLGQNALRGRSLGPLVKARGRRDDAAAEAKFETESLSTAKSQRELLHSCSDLIDHDSKHEDEVGPQKPEQNFFQSREVAAGTMLLLLGRNKLIGFKSGDDVGEIVAFQLGNIGIFHLFASYERKSVRRDHADSEQNAGRNQDDDDSESEDVSPQGADEIAHNLSVVDQHIQEQ